MKGRYRWLILALPLSFTAVVVLSSCNLLASSGGAPTNLTASVPSGTIAVQLTWSAVSGSGYTYLVYRGTSSGGESGPISSSLTNTSFLDGTVQGSTTYYYVVTAVDSSGNESPWSNEASTTTPAAGTVVPTVQ